MVQIRPAGHGQYPTKTKGLRNDKEEEPGHHEPADITATNPVSERALVARINRALAKQHESLHRCRMGTQASNDLGAYYVLDVYRNLVLATHVDIEALGRELNVLGDGETLEAK